MKLPFFAIAVAALFLPMLSNAQNARAVPWAVMSMDSIRSRLGLTDQQAARVEPIFQQANGRRMDAIFDSKAAGTSWKTMRDLLSEMKAITAETDSQLRPILSPDQMEAYLVMQEEMRDKIRAEFTARRGMQ